MSIISVHGVTKIFNVKKKNPGLRGSFQSMIRPVFEEKVAVYPLHLSIEKGETVAFLGPNGAGKSTTIKMLTGILHPTSGEASVLGHVPWKDRKKLAFKLGAVFGQKSQLWYHLPPSDTFELMSRIYEIPRQDYFRRRDQLVEQFDLAPYMDTPVRKLSLGERMRCEITAALLHRPEVIFLDEPTIGLDVVVKQKIRQFIRQINKEEGVTVFLTSHDAGDVAELCKRAIVINHGQVIFDDHVRVMKRNYLKYKVINVKLKNAIKSLPFAGVDIIKQKGTGVKLEIDISQQKMEEVLNYLIQHFGIEDITIEDPTMEQVITNIYSRSPISLSGIEHKSGIIEREEEQEGVVN
jgi:ABC-2 type transport system ATP-binding protein